MPGRVQAVERAAAILQVLAVEGDPVSLAQVSAALGLAKPTAHGLLQTLREVGFVDQDAETGCYGLGTGLLELTSARVDANEVRSLALNWTDSLAAHSGEAAQVGIYAAGSVLVVHDVLRPDAGESRGGPATEDPRRRTGATLPLHATALGKVLTAYDPRAARAVSLGPLESLTYRTTTDRSQLLRDLAEVRDLGWAAEVEEHEPGEASIAAPVRDRSGHVVAAVGIYGTSESLCDGRLRPRQAMATKVVGVARRISREFGHGRET